MNEHELIPEIPEIPTNEELLRQEEEIVKEIKENPKKPEKTKKERKPIDIKSWLTKVVTFTVFGMIGVFFAWANTVRRPDNQVLILIIVFSILFNVLVLFFALGTGVGIEVTKRFYRWVLYKRGTYVNTILVMKTGIVKEFFKKKDSDTNHFKINDTKYVTNPRLLHTYKGFSTYFHREGNPDPLNIWDDKLAGDLSNAEMDTVMNSQGMFDLKEWLEKNKTILIFTAFAIVGAAIGAAVFGYMSYEILRDGSMPIGEVVCSNLPKPPVIPGQVL